MVVITEGIPQQDMVKVRMSHTHPNADDIHVVVSCKAIVHID